jgi:cytochrome c551/c552
MQNKYFRTRRSVAAVISVVGLVCWSMIVIQSSAARQAGQSQKPDQSVSPAKDLTDAQMAQMNSVELATYIFENHGCKNCHTMGKNGKLGYTERGSEVGKNFIGCIALLTSMNVIAQEKERYRTAAEKDKATKFKEFGCTTCHQITPGKMGLTPYGVKLKSMHQACTDVEKILSSNDR